MPSVGSISGSVLHQLLNAVKVSHGPVTNVVPTLIHVLFLK